MRYWLKTCPHCRRGDVLEEQDPYGRCVKCLQCGYVLTEGEVSFLLGTVIAVLGAADADPVKVAA